MKLRLVGIIVVIILMLATAGVMSADGPITTQSDGQYWWWMPQVPIDNPYEPDDSCNSWCKLKNMTPW